MPYQLKRHSEFQDRVEVCPDCGVALVEVRSAVVHEGVKSARASPASQIIKQDNYQAGQFDRRSDL